MSTVDILVENTLKDEKYFPCPVEWSVEDAIELIQREHALIGGAIRCGNRPLRLKDIIGDRKEGDMLRFVNGTPRVQLQQQLTSSSAEIFLIRGRMKFSKLRSGCRLSVFQLSEKCHGKIREGVADDGIRYEERSEHLIFQLVFEEKSQAEDFIISVRKIPQNYRKRKLSETTSNVPPELEVELEPMRKITNNLNLVLITTEDYQRVVGESDESPEVSMFSRSQFSFVELTPEVRFRLISKESIIYCKKPEKCHLISQSKYKDDKNNPNNIIFMLRDLHEYFDALNSTEGIPMFYLEYVSHDPTAIQGIVNEKPCPVYETTVKAVFKNEEAMSVISYYFKSHTVISNTEIQFVLHFPSPEEFKDYAKQNAEIKISQWKSYDGVQE